MARPQHRHDTFHRGNVPESQLGTGTATDGYVLTATATGSAAWEVSTATATAGELLMQDGVTAPPVPIENEAQDDWLYED